MPTTKTTARVVETQIDPKNFDLATVGDAPPGGSGCGCNAPGTKTSAAPIALAALGIAFALLRRRT